MGNFTLGLQAMLRIWGDADFAERVRQEMASAAAPAIAPPVVPVAPVAPVPPPAPRRSEALSLLAVLQREARFVDFVKEPIDGYSDEQIGAAVRDIHRDSAAAIERIFALEPLRAESEGAAIQVPAGYDSAQFRLVGNVTGRGPFRGTLAHPGWQAAKTELPVWTGREEAALVVAPAEVEVK